MKKFSSVEEFVHDVKTSFTQWERLRNPLAGWVRVALVITLPFLLWTHNVPLLILWVAAAIIHPHFIPVYVVAGKEAPLFTRLTDAAHKWYEDTPPRERWMDIFPCAVLALPMLWALWSQLAFWAVYFYAAAVISKALFLYRLLQQKNHGEESHA